VTEARPTTYEYHLRHGRSSSGTATERPRRRRLLARLPALPQVRTQRVLHHRQEHHRGRPVHRCGQSSSSRTPLEVHAERRGRHFEKSSPRRTRDAGQPGGADPATARGSSPAMKAPRSMELYGQPALVGRQMDPDPARHRQVLLHRDRHGARDALGARSTGVPQQKRQDVRGGRGQRRDPHDLRRRRASTFVAMT